MFIDAIFYMLVYIVVGYFLRFPIGFLFAMFKDDPNSIELVEKELIWTHCLKKSKNTDGSEKLFTVFFWPLPVIMFLIFYSYALGKIAHRRFKENYTSFADFVGKFIP